LWVPLVAREQLESFGEDFQMRKLGVGVLGVGEMGKRHAENVRRLVPEARLVAVADAAAERARQVATELEIEHSYGSLDEMLQCKDLDAVVIATPDKFHAQAIEIAARAGKAIGAEYCRRASGARSSDQSTCSLADWVHAAL
jgi:glutamyl-tRNA reductase